MLICKFASLSLFKCWKINKIYMSVAPLALFGPVCKNLSLEFVIF